MGPEVWAFRLARLLAAANTMGSWRSRQRVIAIKTSDLRLEHRKVIDELHNLIQRIRSDQTGPADLVAAVAKLPKRRSALWDTGKQA